MGAMVMLRLAADLPSARIAQLTRDFSRDLARTGIEARLPEASKMPGQKGEIINLGQLALALVTSGAVTALIECLKAYLARDRTLVFKLTRPDGTEVEVNAKNADDAVVRRALETAAPV